MEKNISKEIWMLIVHHNSSTELLKEKDILQSESMIVACFLLSSLPPAGVLLNCNVNNSAILPSLWRDSFAGQDYLWPEFRTQLIFHPEVGLS